MDDLRFNAMMTARAEERVRDFVDFQMLQAMQRRVKTVGDVLAAKHYGLSSSASPVAYGAAWRR